MNEALISVVFADVPLITTTFINSFTNLEMPDANITYIGVLLCSLPNFYYHSQDILRNVVSRFSIRDPFCVQEQKLHDEVRNILPTLIKLFQCRIKIVKNGHQI